MKMYLNDRSFRSDIQLADPNTLVGHFIDVCDRIKQYSFDKIHLPNDYTSHQIVAGYTLNTFLANCNRTSPIYQKLKGLMANQFVKIDKDDYDENPIQYVKWQDEESEFLKRAFNTNNPVISFQSLPDFCHHQIPITNEYLDVNEGLQSENATINNLSEDAHFNALDAFLTEKQLEIAEKQTNWNALETPIRFVERTTQYLAGINYNENRAHGNVDYKVGLAKMAGTYVAALNGWEYKSRLSERNGRKVFKALNQLVYLSIDTQHGTFEIHNRNGIHCYEINFTGEVLEDAQHNHDIEV